MSWPKNRPVWKSIKRSELGKNNCFKKESFCCQTEKKPYLPTATPPRTLSIVLHDARWDCGRQWQLNFNMKASGWIYFWNGRPYLLQWRNWSYNLAKILNYLNAWFFRLGPAITSGGNFCKPCRQTPTRSPCLSSLQRARGSDNWLIKPNSERGEGDGTDWKTHACSNTNELGCGTMTPQGHLVLSKKCII